MKLETMESLVTTILISSKRARKDDYFLYALVCLQLCPQCDKMSFTSVLCNQRNLSLPKWESVTRTRRRVQNKHPELFDSKTKLARAEEEQIYREYAKSH